MTTPRSTRRAALQHITGTVALGMLTPPSTARADVLGPLIAAASDLQGVLPGIVAAFSVQDALVPGRAAAPFRLIFGASAVFARQIRQGAPFAVFLSADAALPEALVRDGFTTTAAMPYARGRLAVLAHRRLALLPATTLEGVAARLREDKTLRVALANPEHAPYGARAVECIAALGLEETLRGRLIFGENAAQAAQFVASGAVPLGFTGQALAKLDAVASATTAIPVPETLHAPLIQCGVVLKKAPPEAARFFSFLTGEAGGRQLLRAHGFG